ncbi:MAG: chemotaxis protein CheW [Acidobacteriota bacterium]
MTAEEAASPAGGAGTHFLFRRHTQLFAVSVADVAEVIEVPAKTRVPATASVVDGVINHHGDILPVLHINTLLEIAGDAAPTSEKEVVGFIVGEGEGRMVVPIDATLGLVQLPAEGDEGEGLIRRTVVVEDQAIAVLDVNRMMETVETTVTAGWGTTTITAER